MSRNKIILFLIIIAVLIVAGYFFINPKAPQTISRSTAVSVLASSLFKTEAWLGLDGYPGGISLRTTSDADLLLKHNNADIVYRYSTRDNQFSLVNLEIWSNATGETVDCNTQVEKEPWRIKIDRETNKLLVDDKEVKGIKGQVHLRYQFTSRGDKFAVLSAGGKKASSLLPFLGEGGASGAHYNQVFSFPDLTSMYSVTELPFTTEKITYRSCWSFDESYIVYSDALDSRLAIIVVE
ncbi:MAG: hypothetical protein G01um101430_508 [Parcubacteria group bacterium Gr01-1014_30]|nr:MAG: hypothetical protein G01um101430_508 [Parcubacteria group bacterium Gr01-1014_30]